MTICTHNTYFHSFSYKQQVTMVPRRIPIIGETFTDLKFDRTKIEHVLKDSDILSGQQWLDIQCKSPDAFCVLVINTGIPSVIYNMALMENRYRFPLYFLNFSLYFFNLLITLGFQLLGHIFEIVCIGKCPQYVLTPENSNSQPPLS